MMKFFNSSATAAAAAAEPNLQGIPDTYPGLVQVVCDNFDADMYSPNGKLTTHALGMILTQTSVEENIEMNTTIRHLRKDDLT